MNLSLLSLSLLLSTSQGFQPAGRQFTTTPSRQLLHASPQSDVSSADNSSTRRRNFLISGVSSMIGFSAFVQSAAAGIDVTGLRVDGGGAGGNPSIANQLKAYDGSGSARVREIQATSGPEVSIRKPVSTVAVEKENLRDPKATWAYRANPGIGPKLTTSGLLKNLYRYNDQVVAPEGSKRFALNIQFEFPSDWLQLDRNIGGIQYVDQRNGDKLYVFRAPLPEGTSLDTVSKSVVGDLIFDPNGSLIKTGQTVEEYKVASAQVLSQCPNSLCATRRRFKIKYATVTGNGLSVERRGLVDAYQVENDIYMLMTSSNAVKFDKKDSLERETVENIVASFQVDA